MLKQYTLVRPQEEVVETTLTKLLLYGCELLDTQKIMLYKEKVKQV